MIRTIVQLREEQAAQLRKRAKEQGVSISELVRQGVDQLLLTPTQDEEIRRRALAAVGFVHDDATDVAVNHDKYLALAYGQ